MTNESPIVTPTFCHKPRPSSSSSVMSIRSDIPCLTSSFDSSFVTSLEPIAPVADFFHAPSVHQLDPRGYPTRGLYYLHKRMLEVALHPGLYHNQHWRFQIRSGTPVPSPPLRDDDNEGTLVPDNSLEEEDINEFLEEIKQVCSVEEDQDLHKLCVTLVSAEYITPPTPPTGATPCDTPPEFDAPTFSTHDEYACCIARMVVSSSVTELNGRVVEEFEVELECGNTWVLSNCPCGEDRYKMNLLEEMEACASRTPRETRQARRRARNSLKGVARGVIVEEFSVVG
ncbi:unnamed protein product [Rhizoctonia solani]|uniref:Uncharacterized protein n=1 Tax=Rhizoctonia solani TaxID=456999 RepID=A0A8H3HJC3_9AGAM|nr:unnamed protein product [Rhizoctonia solani]